MDFLSSAGHNSSFTLIDLEHIEEELKKRWPYTDKWFRKQNNEWDKRSNFIYNIRDFNEVVSRISATIAKNGYDKKEFFYYSINRWYNFWSAIAVEEIFKNQKEVFPAFNTKNRLVDFSIQKIRFDHKTSKFPRGFGKKIEYAQAHPKELVFWLYKNQSRQNRMHFENRLFIIVYDQKGAHYKLKAEINWLKKLIENYVSTFDPSKLIEVEVQPEKTALSDIIWAIR